MIEKDIYPATEKGVYRFYNDKLKILYSEIETRYNYLPLDLLFKIHSAFDQLKCIHVDGDPENYCAEKAFFHLKQGLLDAFKLKLKEYNSVYKKLIEPEIYKSKSNLQLIDNGIFLPSLLKKRKAIIDIAKEARLSEGKKDIDAAFEKWYEVSGLIDQFERKFFDPEKIQWAKKLGFFNSSSTFIIGIISGIIGSAIVQYLFPGVFKFLGK